MDNDDNSTSKEQEGLIVLQQIEEDQQQQEETKKKEETIMTIPNSSSNSNSFIPEGKNKNKQHNIRFFNPDDSSTTTATTQEKGSNCSNDHVHHHHDHQIHDDIADHAFKNDMKANADDKTRRRKAFEYEKLLLSTKTASFGASLRQQCKLPNMNNVNERSRSSPAFSKDDENLYASIANKEFILFAFVIPSCLVTWYAGSILFPPGAHQTGFGKIFLWTDGALVLNKYGQYEICPRPSICSVGGFQIWMIASARLTAFVSYVFMTFTFVSKMHFFSRFMASTYMRKFVPFERLHFLHTYVGKIYGGLIAIHILTHYIRYMARGDGEQLGTSVHISGSLGGIAMIVMIFGMSAKVRKLKFCNFERRFNLHWFALAVVCIMLCVHHPRARIVALVVV